MKNQYYLKDKKAQIYKQVMNGTDPDGSSKAPSYYPVAPAPVWCYARQLSQTDIFQAQSFGENETRLFVFNYYSNVEVYDMVQYRGKWYRITRVDTTDDYKGDLFVYVQNAKAGFIPKDEEIKPYTPGAWETAGETDNYSANQN